MSPLSQSRLAYQPKFPSSLKHLEKLIYQTFELSGGTDFSSVFPNTFGRVLVRFHPGEGRIAPRALRVGVLFSGGPAPGGHNVIAGLFDGLKELSIGSVLIGFLDGPSGLIENRHKFLTEDLIALYRNQGGFDLIGSGRTKIKTEEQLRATLSTCLKLELDGLVIIGGDDSNTNAAFLAEFFAKENCKTTVVGVPKTIDGDLKNEYVEIPLGFDTACKIYSEEIGNILKDAASSRKYTHFIKIMGRSASHIALECALQTHPNITLISEEKKSLAQITGELADVIIRRSESGKNYGAVIIPEGLIESMGIDMATVSEKRDSHGNLLVAAIETERLLIQAVQEELTKRGFKGKFSPLAHYLGYEGRAAMPSNFDSNYCYTLGRLSGAVVFNQLSGYLCFVQHLNHSVDEWEVGALPITHLLHEEERGLVIQKSLVDLEGESYQYLVQNREAWALHDDYAAPGPIQFFGSIELTEQGPSFLRRQIVACGNNRHLLG